MPEPEKSLEQKQGEPLLPRVQLETIKQLEGEMSTAGETAFAENVLEELQAGGKNPNVGKIIVGFAPSPEEEASLAVKVTGTAVYSLLSKQAEKQHQSLPVVEKGIYGSLQREIDQNKTHTEKFYQRLSRQNPELQLAISRIIESFGSEARESRQIAMLVYRMLESQTEADNLKAMVQEPKPEPEPEPELDQASWLQKLLGKLAIWNRER